MIFFQIFKTFYEKRPILMNMFKKLLEISKPFTCEQWDQLLFHFCKKSNTCFEISFH